MMVFSLSVLVVLFLSQASFGWGLDTHVELAESLLTNSTLLAAGIGSLLIRYRKDFILGNLLADVMIGKKLSARRKSSHHWTGGWRLMENAHHDRTRAFALGFLTHLAADTVAHNKFIPNQIARTGSSVLLGHLYWELMADQLTGPANRKTLRRLLKEPAIAHEQLLEDHLYPDMVWFGFNKSIFTRVTRVTHSRRFNLAVKLCRELSAWPLHCRDLNDYKAMAGERMLDILLNGRKSKLLKEDPNGCLALSNIYEQPKAIILPEQTK